jgi:hypothetical protein
MLPKVVMASGSRQIIGASARANNAQRQQVAQGLRGVIVQFTSK